MKSPAITLLVLSVLILGSVSCDGARSGSTNAPAASEAVTSKADVDQPTTQARTAVAESTAMTDRLDGTVEFKKVSLAEGEKAEETSAAADRKIIRNADLTMEVSSTTDTQHRIVSIAEAHGGFVVTSEAKQRESTEPIKRTLDVRLVVRIPENRFGSALDQIRGLTSNLTEEKVSGQDVTEEFIDLEARIRTQRALELQFLEIMKQARKVEDALEVQRQIADVRTDIEKLEGRKRFLENRASLSTIVVTLEGPRQIIVNTSSFGRSLRESVSEGVDFGSGLLLFLVRFVIIMVPVTIFLLLPAGLVLRYFVRRAKRIQLAEALSTPMGD